MIVKKGSIFFDSEANEYEVIDHLGEGGFGDVYKIQRKNKQNIYALKTLKSPFVDDKVIKSLVNEGRLAQGISHPNVIQYYYFHDGETYKELSMYIIMEYAEGGTLYDVIKSREENNFYSNDELIVMFRQLISGMRAINSKLIHRDVKPDNILIHNDLLKISDFGLSKIVSEATRTSTFKGIGCLPYQAPEGWKFEKNTIQMDIYSMGIVFYELASLEFPYTISRGDYKEWMNVHLFDVAPKVDEFNTNLSPIVSRLIMKMMEKEISNRFKNWDEIETHLNKNEIATTTNSSIIDDMLSKSNELAQKATQEKLKREKREQEILDFEKLVLFQLHKNIINPVKEFVDEFNNKSDGSKIVYHFNSNSYLNTIQYGAKTIAINLEPIIKENFYREVKEKDYNLVHTRKVLQLPRIDERRIMAWGFIKANDGTGFNIILLENDDSPYGEWLLLLNRHRVLLTRTKDSRPEPFPFEMKELENEIKSFGGMHIYVSERLDLDLEYIKGFIGNILV